jgi:hypothetical protein
VGIDIYIPGVCIFVTAVNCHLVTAALSVIKQVEPPTDLEETTTYTRKVPV